MQLDDAGIERLREWRRAPCLVRGHGDHDVIGLHAPVAGVHDIPRAVAPHAIDLDTGVHGQVEVLRVGLEVIRHLVLRRKTEGWRREWQTDEPVVLGGREQAQRVPSLTPGVADARIGLENHKRQSSPCQTVADRQARLAAADDDDLHTLRCTVVVHAPPYQ